MAWDYRLRGWRRSHGGIAHGGIAGRGDFARAVAGRARSYGDFARAVAGRARSYRENPGFALQHALGDNRRPIRALRPRAGPPRDAFCSSNHGDA